MRHHRFLGLVPIAGGGATGGGAGILTTHGGLLFTADNSGDLLALDSQSGKTLWHVYAGGALTGGPVTYELAGRQYVLTAVDGRLRALQGVVEAQSGAMTKLQPISKWRTPIDPKAELGAAGLGALYLERNSARVSSHGATTSAEKQS